MRFEDVLKNGRLWAVVYDGEETDVLTKTLRGWMDPILLAEFFTEHALSIPNCGACLSNMALTPGGNVVPCQSWLSSDALGNFLNDDWDTIWNSDTCKKRRDYSGLMLGRCPLRRAK